MILSLLEATFKKKLKQAKVTFSSMYLFNPVYPIVFQQVIDTKNWSFLVFLFGFFCGLFVGAMLSKSGVCLTLTNTSQCGLATFQVLSMDKAGIFCPYIPL